LESGADAGEAGGEIDVRHGVTPADSELWAVNREQGREKQLKGETVER
jgi:hypothetical protein